MDEMKATSAPASERSALELMSLAERYVDLKEKRFQLLDEFGDDPVLRHPGWEDGYMYRDVIGDRWGCYPLWRGYEWAQESGSKVRTYLDELTSSPIAMVGNHARLMSAVIDGEADPVLENAAFASSLDGMSHQSPTAMQPGIKAKVMTRPGHCGFRASTISRSSRPCPWRRVGTRP